ncbi:hypothetical protein HY631_03585 [Candidatus Uhrbacteria bacterium]|nr:hypothetical protein [Candidatus Uhrbacteria bacterium]
MAFIMIIVQIGAQGLSDLQRRLFVSPETVEIVENLAHAKSQFILACEVWREARGTLDQARECGVTITLPQDGPSCGEREEAARIIEEIAMDEMNEAVEARKNGARALDDGWAMSLLTGTSEYRNGRWLCNSPYAAHGFSLRTSFTPTY